MEEHTSFSELVERIGVAFATGAVVVPPRHHHDFKNRPDAPNNTLLLMPAWTLGQDLGVKVVTVNPENSKKGMPAIQGSYLYMDAASGTLKAIMDAKVLTAKRTAAASALASTFLSRSDAKSLLMIGTGALSINLILAHASVRPLTQIYVWGRDISKAEAIAQALDDATFSIEAVATIESVLSSVDIVSCATLSPDPLVFGTLLVPGQHVDLVGAYKPDMRESDTDVITGSQVYVDSMMALEEAGDLAIPIRKGIIDAAHIRADLAELTSGAKPGRTNDGEVTVFKSVGHALEDLVAAQYYYQKSTHGLYLFE